MSYYKLSYQEFIQHSFSPLVSVMCSPLVDNICKKNNLSFTELIQPFCKLNTEATFRDPSGTIISLKNFRINISDVNSRPPQPTMARKFLNESVSSHVNERTHIIEVGGLRLDVPVSVPWFEAWRDTFLQVQFPSDHEFTKHYLACILVVSSAEVSPLDTLTQMGAQLQQMLTVSPAKLPKWFSPTVLRYHVLLHDNTDGNTALAESIYETMKTTYGVNSVFFLNINSQVATSVDTQSVDPWSRFLNRQVQPQDINEADLEVTRNHLEGQNTVETAQEAGETTPTTPVIQHPLSPITDLYPNTGFEKSVVDDGIPSKPFHGGCLTAEDLDKIREFITCFCLNCLIPHVEQQIQQLTELISNKKGMSRSLLSATKRWFGSNKPGIPNTPTPTITYTHDSTELQLRRLGDLCFMFGAYSLAFTAYHAAKRDFNADAAWLYYAGALEMAALSLFMQPNDPTRKALDYAEESILTYLNSCRMPQFATRATLWTAECLRGRGQSGEAARQLIRMTSEDSDLRSALLLEQASYCFLAAPRPPMPRKYGFHLVLAGHRFSKAGQRRHSLRCYRQAFQVYEGKQWSLAEDHIQHTIGRQASGLKLVVEAAEAFTLLLPRASRQSSTQQATFLREYISTQQQLNSEMGELPTLPLPVVDNDSIQVLLGRPPPPPVEDNLVQVASGVSFDPEPDNSKRWVRLEEQLVTAASGSQPMVFRPSVELLNNNTNNSNPSTTYIGETISVSVSLNNPLHINVTLVNLRLLWSFIPSSGGLCQDNSVTEDSSTAVTQVMERLVIPADMSTKVILQVMPKQVGELRIMGLAYVLEGGEGGGTGVEGRQVLLPRGRRLQSAKDSVGGDNTALYTADHRLRFNVKELAPALRVTFKGLRKDMLCGELTTVIVQCENCGNVEVTRLLVNCATPSVLSLGRPLTNGSVVREVPLPHPLAPGQSLQTPMQVRGHNLKGAFTVDLLFYYESALNQTKPLYRLVRHSWPIQVHDSLQVSVNPSRSAISQDTEETLNLRVQVQNTSQVHDSVKCKVCVMCAALHSPHWELRDRGFHPTVLSLTPQELAHFLVKVRRKGSHVPEVSKLSLMEDSTINPAPDFLPWFEEEGVELSASDNKALESVIALQATFILMWKATVETRGGDSRIAIGQHHVRLSWVGETSWWPPATPTAILPSTPAPTPLCIFGDGEMRVDCLDMRQRLVTFSVVRQPTSTSSHPFASDRVYILPVDVVVQNCCGCDVEVQVDATGSSLRKDYVYSTQSCHLFQWVGCTRRLLRLSPHHSTSVKMAVSVGMPGAYDLSSHLSVRARILPDTDFVAQTWRSEAILVVT